ncbi:MAG: tyrosine-type recombinase/integrase [Thermoleophilaceae bacterium]
MTTGAPSPPGALSFESATQLYLDDMRALGRLTTNRSAAEYRRTVRKHAEDSESADPGQTTRQDVKATLRRWSHPNTQRRKRSMLVSFYDWMVEEGLRADNPARQIRAPRGRAPRVRRLTLDETRAFLAAATGRTERRIAYLGACAGLRCSELRLLQGLHCARAGWILISAEMAKGSRERWVPVMVDLEPIVREIRETTEGDHYVLPATRWVQGDRALIPVEHPERPCDRKTIWRAVRRIGRRAGIGTDVHPHQLRHAFADRVTRLAGLHAAQALLGHVSIQTTEGYLTKPSPDELVEAMSRVTLGTARPTTSSRVGAP